MASAAAPWFLVSAAQAVGLGGLHPGQQVGREEGAGAVVAGGVAVGVQPAGGGQVGADLVLEVDLAVQRHGAWRAQKSAGVRIG